MVSFEAWGKTIFFVVDSGGYLWCIPGKDLIVADVATVQVKDTLEFRDGQRTVTGKILYSTGNLS